MENIHMFYEILSQKCEHEITLIISLSLMKKYVPHIELLQDNKFNPYYRVKVNDLLKQNIENEELMQLHMGGWELSENKEFLVNFIN
jgi:hypothetical protein